MLGQGFACFDPMFETIGNQLKTLLHSRSIERHDQGRQKTAHPVFGHILCVTTIEGVQNLPSIGAQQSPMPHMHAPTNCLFGLHEVDPFRPHHAGFARHIHMERDRRADRKVGFHFGREWVPLPIAFKVSKHPPNSVRRCRNLGSGGNFIGKKPTLPIFEVGGMKTA